MRLQYVSVPGSMAGRLRADASLAPSILMGPMLAAFQPRDLARIQKTIEKKMAGFGMPPPFPRLVRFEEMDGGADGQSAVRPDAVRGELEKAWHGLHLVLTGRADEAPPPLGYLLSGGEEVGEDLGYGAARLLMPPEVQAFRDALKMISEAEFDARFDLGALERNDVYPHIWDEDRDELLEEYQMYFEQLKNDLDQTAAAGEGLLIAIV
jgi:hypothetical protein